MRQESCDGVSTWFVPLPGAVQRMQDLAAVPAPPAYWQWAVLGLAVFVIGFLLFDWWLWKTKGVTYSRWSQWKSKVSKWFVAATIAVLAVFGWHVVHGFERKDVQ